MHEECLIASAKLIEILATMLGYMGMGMPVYEWIPEAITANYEKIMDTCFETVQSQA